MARDAVLKIENVEKSCEKLVDKEKERLKIKLKDVRKKSNEALNSEREKNSEIYKKFVEEFKLSVDKKAEDFKKRVDEQCVEINSKLKKNVSKAVEYVLKKVLQH